ncbi:hypothetical protein [Mesorhizobium sp.]|uniref:hypothetical protein n=1 Tax=Mesorhizobium sp. TaxID=1871066 RepID=UPI000FE484A2|nr:hypothetical protein [Mesorhizobium sp.]RWP58623.1 MAG: hypothetical protein EOR08_26650 [Mesorhizobium sp.]
MTHSVIQRPCNGLSEACACNIVFPADNNTKSYANGDIKLIHLNTHGEPAGGASHLLVAFHQHGSHICVLISYGDGSGPSFGNIDLTAAHSQYDPASGLEVSMPVSVFDGNDFEQKTLVIVVNQQTGTITTSLG